MKRMALLALLLALPATISASDLPPTARCQDRPAWCQAGYICAPTDCGIELRVELEEARMENRELQRQSRRLHFDLTCGLGVATVVTQEWDLKAYPTPGACVAGLALRIGK